MTEVEKKAAEILERVKLGTIGLTQLDGTPHVFTAYIAADEKLNVYFLSVRGSGHANLLKEVRQAAMAVYDSRQEWDEWKDGIQMWGRLRLAVGKEDEEGRRCYEGRFPEYKVWLEGEGKVVKGRRYIGTCGTGLGFWQKPTGVKRNSGKPQGGERDRAKDWGCALQDMETSLLRVPTVGELRVGLGMPSEDVVVGSTSRLVDPFALARPVPV